MVDPLKNNQEKLAKAYKELESCPNPIERERIITKIDNLLDIRLDIQRHQEEVKAMANGD